MKNRKEYSIPQISYMDEILPDVLMLSYSEPELDPYGFDGLGDNIWD